MLQMVREKEKKTNFSVSALACDEVNSDSIILMKSVLARCDRNKKESVKKIHEAEKMRKMGQDESLMCVGGKKSDSKKEASGISGMKVLKQVGV